MQTRKIAILYNRVRYDHLDNRSDSIVRETEIHWIPINALATSQYTMEIQK